MRRGALQRPANLRAGCALHRLWSHSRELALLTLRSSIAQMERTLTAVGGVVMNGVHDLSEQLYLAFHDWRARLDNDLDRLRTDYLRSLHTDIQRTLAHIEHELATRRQTDRAERPERAEHTTRMPVLEAQAETEVAYQASVTEGGQA